MTRGNRFTSVQYLAIPSGKALKKGYYFFESDGKLCIQRVFHKVDTKTNNKRFRGTYYFGLENGQLYMKRGWKLINKQKYYLSSSGRRYENCWKGGYYLRSDGKIARKQKLPDGTYVDCDGKPCKKEEMALSSLKKEIKKMTDGYGKTGCHSTLHPSSSPVLSDGKRNQTSARDCAVLLERIYKGTCVSKKYSREMEKLLLQQKRRWKIPAGLPAGTKVANKTGETSSSQHDIAIVYGKKTDYVLCVFSQGCYEGRAVAGIKNISRRVYDYLN